MDFVKIWGNLLAASSHTNLGTNVCTTLPTTYFMQGVHVFAYANDTNSNSPSSASTSSSAELESDESSTYVPDGSHINNVQGCEYPEDDEQEKEQDGIENDNVLFSDDDVDDLIDNNNEEVAIKRTTASSTTTRITRGKRIQRIRYSREEYKCTSCPYTCTTEKAFFKHLRVCQETKHEPRLSCPICGKDRDDEQLIVAHMAKHKDGKQFCCDLCKFRTLQLKKLIQHRRMHTGEKPHLCPFCTYRSARRDNLRSHVRRVHKKENLTCDTFTPRSMLLTPTLNALAKLKDKENNFVR